MDGTTRHMMPAERQRNGDEVALLVTTCAKNEKYMADVLALIEAHWPDHPPLTVASDHGAELPRGDIATVLAPGSWVELLLAAVLDIRRRDPVAYVAFLLEDLCPQVAVDTAVFATASAALRESAAGMVSMSCFDLYWVFDESGARVPDQQNCDWGHYPVERHGDLRFRRMPDAYKYYFSVQPSIWRIDYLIEACEAALAQGIASPWQFEEMRWSGARPHLVADYIWPAMHHGFLLQGAPNRHGIASITSHAGRPLRQRLIREAFGSPWRYYAWRIRARAGHWPRRALEMATRGRASMQ